jgi:hypothetical protein
MKTKTTPPIKEIDVENLHQIFKNSPSVQKLLSQSDKFLEKIKLPIRQM